jgi:hypothetical protein
MNKRVFLGTIGAAGLLPATRAAGQQATQSQPTLLTVSGEIARANRGRFDPVVDQMMGKHAIHFEKAYEFDAPTLQRLPAVTIKPTLEYDGKQHALAGPLLATVLDATVARDGGNTQITLRAVDGYNVTLTRAEVSTYRMMVALRLDDRPIGLGGFGPQWAIYDADNVTPFKDKPLKERFALCPWGLYHVDVKAG